MVVSVATYGIAILALLGLSQGIPKYRAEPDCPQFCTANYDPVCGSDGQTYGNDCELSVASCEDPSITKDYGGECRVPDCPQICPAIYAPVCGSDGQTYSNECALRIAACEDSSITKASDGICGTTRQTDCPQICPQNYAPVCGSDGRTYSNDCGLAVAACDDPSIRKVSDGECGSTRQTDCPQICPANYAPVCGSDGRTYSNDCRLSVSACEDPSITKANDGECGQTVQTDCARICFPNYVPVCGSNGKTYDNECGLDAAACEDPSIQLAYEGECKPECPQICTANYDPVCGSDGQTYGNDCELSIASCEDPSITKKNDGECKPSCPQICPAIFAPVCGSNGQTYSNECQLNVAACRDKSITKVSNGDCVCVHRICTEQYDPVCGSDEISYDNNCYFMLAKRCDDPLIRRLCYGTCSQCYNK